MSAESIKYLDGLLKNNISLYYNSFVISLIGIVGLAKLNEHNNKVNLKMKQYRVILNSITNKDIDVYIMIQHLFNTKMITLNYAIELVALLQVFRQSNFDINVTVKKLSNLLKSLPSSIKQKLSSEVRIIADTVDENNISELVIKLYNYAGRKGITKLDFLDMARITKRI